MANFLYNSKELPDIYTVYTPELQKTHPFAYISYMSLTKTYYLYCSREELGVSVSSTGKGLIPRNLYTTTAIGFTCKADGWSRGTDGEFEITASGGVWNAFWTNTDLYYAKHYSDETLVGTLYLAASDPIPVGSSPEVDPKSFMAGWRMGQFVKYYGIGV